MNELDNVISNMKSYVKKQLLIAQNEKNPNIDGIIIDDEVSSGVLAECLNCGYNPKVMDMDFVLESFKKVYIK